MPKNKTPKNKLPNIAQRIRDIRYYKGMKQQAVSLSLEVSQQSYSLLEKQANNARLSTLVRICDVFQIPLSYLVSHEPINRENILKHTINN